MLLAVDITKEDFENAPVELTFEQDCHISRVNQDFFQRTGCYGVYFQNRMPVFLFIAVPIILVLIVFVIYKKKHS